VVATGVAMHGSKRSRLDLGKGNGLRFRCAKCRVLRKIDNIDGNHGGEDHASPGVVASAEGYVCGWCVARAKGEKTFEAKREDGTVVVRDVKTGRVLSKTVDQSVKDRRKTIRTLKARLTDSMAGIPTSKREKSRLRGSREYVIEFGPANRNDGQYKDKRTKFSSKTNKIKSRHK